MDNPRDLSTTADPAIVETKRIFASFSKVEDAEDGMIRVYGVASSETKDHDGEVIKAAAVKTALPDWLVFGNIREMHQPIAAGTAIEATVDDDGVTHLGALIVDPSTVKKIRAGVLKGFSLGGKVTKRNSKDKSIIEGLRLTEISVVDRPANPDALITLAKFDSAGRRKAAGAQASAETETDEPLTKGLYDVGRLASLILDLSYCQTSAVYEAANEGDGSLMPSKLKVAVQTLVDCLREMVDEETRELLGGMLDVASMKKAVDDRGLSVAIHAVDVASLTKALEGAGLGDLVTKAVESLGLKKTANAQGDTPMTDELKKAVADAVAEQTATLSKSVTDLTKTVDGQKTEIASLTDKLSKSEEARVAAEKLAQDIADKAVEKGLVKAVPKSGDTPASGQTADDIAKAKAKPTDFDDELRSSFKRPLSPVRGL